jgi:hypothetical protein
VPAENTTASSYLCREEAGCWRDTRIPATEGRWSCGHSWGQR